MFTDYLGKSPRAVLLDFLGDHPGSDYNITELSERCGLGRPTLYKLIPELVEVDMLLETRSIGQSRMFKINMEHPVIQSELAADMLAARGIEVPILPS